MKQRKYLEYPPSSLKSPWPNSNPQDIQCPTSPIPTLNCLVTIQTLSSNYLDKKDLIKKFTVIS